MPSDREHIDIEPRDPAATGRLSSFIGRHLRFLGADSSKPDSVVPRDLWFVLMQDQARRQNPGVKDPRVQVSRIDVARGLVDPSVYRVTEEPSLSVVAPPESQEPTTASEPPPRDTA